MPERQPKTPDNVDPRNGYSFFWQSQIVSRNTLHSLIVVPMKDPIEILHRRPQSGLDYFFSPVDNSQDWILEGTISSNTLQSLGMPITALGFKASRPVVTPEDLERISDHGKIEKIEESDRYNVAFWLPEVAILSLLHGIWSPPIQENGTYAPAYRLRDFYGENRVLPQKIVADPFGRSPRSTIQVIRK